MESDSFSSLNLEYIFLLIYRLFTAQDGSNVLAWITDIWFGITIASAIAVPLLLFGYLYVSRQHHHIMHEEEERYRANAVRFEGRASRNVRWQEVIDLVNSDVPNNWRLAVIEADIILDDLLKRLGYLGDTMGERLKAVDRGTFKTLDQAWEAHRVRNQIAHEGSDFILTQREGRRVVDLFRQVFEEHGII